MAIVGAAAVASGLAVVPAGIATGHELGEMQGVAITQTNLISDQAGKAALVDPSLVNPWGMSFGTGASATPLWISDNGADVATLYRGATTPPSLAKVPLTISIPGGEPTGQVFN
ncbi:MAG: TIGR03118 family protein, partial [Acidothermaceae bacterium]